MDITPQDNTATQPISDDQELAKALAGVLPDEPDAAPATSTMQFEETPAAVPTEVSAPAPAPAPAVAPLSIATDPSGDTATFGGLPTPSSMGSAVDLSSIKNNALNELRPLMSKVELPAEEKFDTYLMLIRSTDDTSLIEPAHAAAQNISDEKRKAEALLDIIKEIDYLSRKDQEPKA